MGTLHNKLSQNLGKNDSSVESFEIPSGNMYRLTKKQMDFVQLPTYNKHRPLNFQIPNPLLEMTNNVSLENKSLDNGLKHQPYKSTNFTFQVFKGIRNVILSAKDVSFIAEHPIAKTLFNWFQLGSFTEEHFY